MSTARKEPLPFPLPEDLTGCKVGRFEVKVRLGSGGMGEVYRAEDTKLRRPVALKRVARRLGNNPTARSHILQEAQRASALNSEHIASVHDVVEENGELFLVMEYVEGETLRKRLDRPISLKEFFSIASQSAEGLVAAHDHGIVHCDIKPENILIAGGSKVKILDFGVARRCPQAKQMPTQEASTIEPAGQSGGTPGYMAPEVLLEQTPDARSDIFSLGVVMYEVLTGQRPFGGSSFLATSDRVLHEDPRPIRVLRPDIPEQVAAVVQKAMAKDAAQRYPGARELLGDLQHAAEGNATQAGRDAARVRLQRKAWRWALAGLGVLVIGVAAWMGWKWKNAPPKLAERGWVLITDFDTPADGSAPQAAVREGLSIALQQSQYVNVFPRARAYEVLQRMRKPGARIDEALGREICQRENLQVLLAGSVEHTGGVYQMTVRGIDPAHGNLLFVEQQRFTKESEFFEKTDTLARNVRRELGESLEHIQTGTRPLARVTTSSLEALQLYSQAKNAVDQGKNEPVAELLKSALRLDPGFAIAHLELGRYYLGVVEKNDKAVEELERAYRLRGNVTDRERRLIEAGYYQLHEQYGEGEQALEALVSLYPDDEDAHRELASAYFDLNEADRAVAELQEVLRLNSSSPIAYSNRVLFLAYQSKADDAVKAYHEAENRGFATPRMHWGLGLAYLGMDDVTEAKKAFEEIGRGTETDRQLRALCMAVTDLYVGKLNAAKAQLTQQVRDLPPEAGGLQVFARYLLARVYLEQGNREAAAREADLMLRVPLTGLQVTDLRNAGILYARAGKIGKAQQIVRKIDEIGKQFPSSSNRSGLHNLEGEIYMAEGKIGEAEGAFVAAAQEVDKPISHIGLARAYEREGQLEAAAREWEQVLADAGQILHNDFPPDLAYADVAVGHLYLRMNNPALARSHYERFLHRWQKADNAELLAKTTRELSGLT